MWFEPEQIVYVNLLDRLLCFSIWWYLLVWFRLLRSFRSIHWKYSRSLLLTLSFVRSSTEISSWCVETMKRLNHQQQFIGCELIFIFNVSLLPNDPFRERIPELFIWIHNSKAMISIDFCSVTNRHQLSI